MFHGISDNLEFYGFIPELIGLSNFLLAFLKAVKIPFSTRFGKQVSLMEITRGSRILRMLEYKQILKHRSKRGPCCIHGVSSEFSILRKSNPV